MGPLLVPLAHVACIMGPLLVPLAALCFQLGPLLVPLGHVTGIMGPLLVPLPTLDSAATLFSIKNSHSMPSLWKVMAKACHGHFCCGQQAHEPNHVMAMSVLATFGYTDPNHLSTRLCLVMLEPYNSALSSFRLMPSSMVPELFISILVCTPSTTAH